MLHLDTKIQPDKVTLTSANFWTCVPLARSSKCSVSGVLEVKIRLAKKMPCAIHESTELKSTLVLMKRRT